MYQKVLKRLLDILISVLLLPIVGVVILVTAPFIFVFDPGPIFFNGLRRGKNGKTFKMYKLRSMYLNAPDLRNSDGSTYNSDADSRVTPIGKILRKSSLDEIPQIINVLIGDMSFIGPRPTLATKTYDEIPAERKKRYNVRPGITGYAQAYFRNSISQEEKFKWDLYYVDHISFGLDMKILLKTILSVLHRENIYNQNNI